MQDNLVFFVENEDNNKRLDVVLTIKIHNLSRSYIKKLIDGDYVKVNKQVVKASYKVEIGDQIEINIPAPTPIDIAPENIPIKVIYEDSDVIIINKAQGMVVHPAPGNYTGTLVNALLYHNKSLSGINGQLRPGIVHRIDKDTSGLLMIAKNDMAHRRLAEQLKEHSITRKYLAITEGLINNEHGTISMPIGRHPVDRKRMAVTSKNSKAATTHFIVIERFKENTMIEARLETGRTHQIRVHMEYIGHPLVGDPIYGNKKQQYNLQGQLLHAQSIGFIHPTQNTYVEFNSELPEHFKRMIQRLRAK